MVRVEERFFERKKMRALSVEKLNISVLDSRSIWGVLGLIPVTRTILKYVGLLPPKKTILKDITFSVEQGECFGIIGFNGSGKTTLCNALANIIPVTQGKIQATSRVTLCSNDLHGHFTILDNIQMGTRLFHLCPEAVNAMATTLLKKLIVKDEDFSSESEHLSFGTKAKVALVRSIIISLRDGEVAPIIVLDEPTRGFDVRAVREFKECIHKLRKLIPDLTIIISTNQEHELCLCDRYTAIIKDSQVNEPEKLEKLRSLHHKYVDDTAELFESMISADSIADKDQDNEQFVLNRIPIVKQSANPFLWRGKREIKRNPFLSIILIISLVVPNLFPLFSSKEKDWGIFAACACGIYFTCIMRAFYRVISRESTYYHCLNLIMQSEYRGLKHLYAAGRSSLIQDSIIAAFTVCLLGLSLLTHLQFPDLTLLSTAYIVKFIILLSSSIMFSVSVGIILSPLMKSMKGDNAFLLLSVMPFLILLLSGLYYVSNDQIFGLHYLAKVMPYSILGDHIRSEVHALDVAKCVGLTIIWFYIARALYTYSLHVLYLAMRLKD